MKFGLDRLRQEKKTSPTVNRSSVGFVGPPGFC